MSKGAQAPLLFYFKRLVTGRSMENLAVKTTAKLLKFMGFNSSDWKRTFFIGINFINEKNLS
jgi:hypothetical protein